MGKISRKRFRKLLLPLEEMSSRAEAWAEALAPVRAGWTRGLLTPPETAALYLVTSLRFWFEGGWLSGPDPLHDNAVPDSAPLKSWLELDRRTRAKLPDTITVAGLIHGYAFKSVRRDARQALMRWLAGEIDLTLTDNIPTPLEVLDAQVEGRRWVSALFRAEELKGLVHDGRDALSFLLHDLGHAEKFFGGLLETDAQIGCYRLLRQALNAGKFERLARADSQWEERLHYLIADLNSHPVHILSVFWATARESFEKHAGPREFARWRDEIYDLWGWEPPLREALADVIKTQSLEAAARINSQLKSVPADAYPHPPRTSVWPPAFP